MSSTNIVTVDPTQAVRSLVTPALYADPVTVHSCPVDPTQAVRVAAKLGLTPDFVQSLAKKHVGKTGVWRTVAECSVAVQVVNRLPSPAGVTEVQLNPVRHSVLRLPYTGAPCEYVIMVRVLFSTYTGAQRTATLTHRDGAWQAALRGFPPPDGIALQGVGTPTAQSYMLVLAFAPDGRLMTDVTCVCWVKGASSPKTWSALADMPTLIDSLYKSCPDAWVAVQANQAALPQQPTSAASVDETAVMQWFASIPIDAAYTFLQNASAVYAYRVKQEYGHE